MILLEEHRELIQDNIDNATTEGSKYPGMTYEEGMEAVLMLLRGDVSIEDIT